MAELHETKVIKVHLQSNFFFLIVVKIVPDKNAAVLYAMKVNIKYQDSVLLKYQHSITIENIDRKYEKF